MAEGLPSGRGRQSELSARRGAFSLCSASGRRGALRHHAGGDAVAAMNAGTALRSWQLAHGDVDPEIAVVLLAPVRRQMIPDRARVDDLPLRKQPDCRLSTP